VCGCATLRKRSKSSISSFPYCYLFLLFSIFALLSVFFIRFHSGTERVDRKKNGFFHDLALQIRAQTLFTDWLFASFFIGAKKKRKKPQTDYYSAAVVSQLALALLFFFSFSD
jgi:hypothetical protein